VQRFSAVVLSAILSLGLLIGCGGEKPSEKADKGSPEVSNTPTAGSATKTTDTRTAATGEAAEGENQVITIQTGDQEVSVVTGGDQVVVKSADGKETRLNVEKVQSLAQAISDAAKEGETAEPPSDTDTQDTSSESKAPSTVKIDTGKATLTVGESQVPEDFPLPAYEGANVEYSAHVKPESAKDEEVYQLHLTSPDAPDAVAKFYLEAFKKAGLSMQRLDQKINETTIVTITGESPSDGISASAQAQRDPDADTTRIIIIWKRQP